MRAEKLRARLVELDQRDNDNALEFRLVNGRPLNLLEANVHRADTRPAKRGAH